MSKRKTPWFTRQQLPGRTADKEGVFETNWTPSSHTFFRKWFPKKGRWGKCERTFEAAQATRAPCPGNSSPAFWRGFTTQQVTA